MTEMIFVDTNIFVCARDHSQQRKQLLAERHLTHLWRERTGRTSMQVLSEYYVTITRKLKPGVDADRAWDEVSALMAWKPQPTDGPVLTKAREIERRYRTSWWDAMIVAAAQTQGCTTLLTEDLQHGMVFEGLTVRNPFIVAVEETAVPYIAVKSRPGHRGRGRPTRVA